MYRHRRKHRTWPSVFARAARPTLNSSRRRTSSPQTTLRNKQFGLWCSIAGSRRELAANRGVAGANGSGQRLPLVTAPAVMSSTSFIKVSWRTGTTFQLRLFLKWAPRNPRSDHTVVTPGNAEAAPRIAVFLLSAFAVPGALFCASLPTAPSVSRERLRSIVISSGNVVSVKLSGCPSGSLARTA